jgi:hypothetical protein
MTEQFRLWVGLMIIGNFLITYVTEKFGIWYLSVWWKNRQDRKRLLERQQEIEEEERAMDPLLTNYGQPENQTNLLVQIAETEANVEEVEEVKEEQENKVCDEAVSYTDPMGNTFEAPIVIDSIDLNRETKMSVIISPCAAHDLEADKFMDAPDETIEEVPSLEPTPEDHLVFETQQRETEDDFAFDFSDDEDDDGNSFF